MNISPVSLVNFKSTIKNTQNSTSAKEDSATSPINNIKVSREALKANFCSQIAFKGNNDSNDILQLSQETRELIAQGNPFERFNYKFAKKLENGTATKGELTRNLNIQNIRGRFFADVLAEYHAKIYLGLMQNYTTEEQLAFLKLSGKGRNSVAHTLALEPESYIEATKDFTKEERLDLLKIKNENRTSVARILAYEPKFYIEATKDFTKEERLDLLKMSNKNRDTVAHLLALKPIYYLEATKEFTPEEQLTLFKMTNNEGKTVVREFEAAIHINMD